MQNLLASIVPPGNGSSSGNGTVKDGANGASDGGSNPLTAILLPAVLTGEWSPAESGLLCGVRAYGLVRAATCRSWDAKVHA